MPIDEEYLGFLTDQANSALQDIQNHCGREKHAAAKIKFPRGYIRTARETRLSLPDLGTPVQQRNASYALMKHDVFRWLATRTDLWGAPLSMIVKEGISSIGSILEWLTKEATRGHASNRPYAQRTTKLVELEVISDDLKIELDWVWEMRCRDHMHEVVDLEHEMYTRTDYNRAVSALNQFRNKLIERHGRVEV